MRVVQPFSILSFLALVTGGCAGETFYIAETFQGSAAGWIDIDAGGERPATDLEVNHGRLAIRGVRILGQNTLFFERFFGIVDVAFSGGDEEGFAGIFVEERSFDGGSERIVVTCLAVSPRGVWKGYDGDPLRPPLRLPWMPRVDPDVLKPVRLVFEKDGDDIHLRLAGSDRSGGHTMRATPAPEDGQPSEYRVGIFTRGVEAVFDNFIVGDATSRGRFEPAAHVDWGTARDAEELRSLARSRARSFQRSPHRMAFHGCMEPLHFARRIYQQLDDPERTEELSESAYRMCMDLRTAIEGAGANDLLQMALRTWRQSQEERSRLMESEVAGLLERARRAEADGRNLESLILSLAAREFEDTEELEERIRRLRPMLDHTLRLDFRTQDRSAGELSGGDRHVELGVGEFTRPVLEAYGRIPRSRDGPLRVDLVVQEARLVSDRSRATRRLRITRSRDAMSPAQRRELTQLKEKFLQDLLDSRTRAKVLRAGNLTPELESHLRVVSFDVPGGEDVEVHSNDVNDLRAACRRLKELESLETREVQSTAQVVTLPATSITDQARFAIGYRVSLDGKVVLQGVARGIAGLEQWEHPADPERGIGAARYSPAERDDIVERARRRVLSRLETAISLDSLFGKLDPDAASHFLVRLARATRSREDQSLLRWRLKSQFALSGLTLESVTRELLE